MTHLDSFASCSAKIVIPHNGISCSLPSITFGNFIPQKFQSILKEGEDKSTNSNSCRSLHLQNFRDSIGPLVNRHLQFFVEINSTNNTPLVTPEYGENRAGYKGRSLSYVPLTMKQGKISVSIIKDDIRSKTKYYK